MQNVNAFVIVGLACSQKQGAVGAHELFEFEIRLKRFQHVQLLSIEVDANFGQVVVMEVDQKKLGERLWKKTAEHVD